MLQIQIYFSVNISNKIFWHFINILLEVIYDTLLHCRRLGQLDDAGNRIGDQGELRSFRGNSNSNLQNLVNQNRNFATNLGDQSDFDRLAGGLRQRNQFDSQQGFGTLQGTSVSRRPLGTNFDGFQRNHLLEQQNQQLTTNRFPAGQPSQFLNDQFSLSQQGFRSNTNSRPFQQSVNRRLGQTGQFVTPSFQNQIASRLSVDEGGSFRSTAQQAALTHGSDIVSDSTGTVASYRVSS